MIANQELFVFQVEQHFLADGILLREKLTLVWLPEPSLSHQRSFGMSP